MTPPDLRLRPSALITFRAENARSFRDEIEFSMLATAMAEKDCIVHVPWRREGTPMRVLPAAGIFGANASGKSNLLKVMDDMSDHVLYSFRVGAPSGGMPRQPFRLDEASGRKPSLYEITIVLRGVRHDYGMAIDDDRVVEEWAYHFPKGRAALLFHREGDDVRLGATERARSRAVLGLLRPNALFLSTAAAVGHPVLFPLYHWFQHNLRLADSRSRRARQLVTAYAFADQSRNPDALELIRAADFGVTDVETKALDPALREEFRRALEQFVKTDDERAHLEAHAFSMVDEAYEVKLLHQGDGLAVAFEEADESLGTLVWLGLIGPVLDSLNAGSVLLADELDASLHPDLVARLVHLFQDPETNPLGAQLVFNSHDTNLLGNAIDDRPLGRDQIWFTQKLNNGRTQLYSLANFNPRKQEAIAKRYLNGWYGATPIFLTEKFELPALEAKVASS